MELIRTTAGKTVASVVTNGVNHIELVFSDGTSLKLDAVVTAGGGALINETMTVGEKPERKIDPGHLIKANDGTPYRVIRYDGMERWNGPSGLEIVGAYATAEAVWDFIEAEFRAAETRDQRSDIYMLQVELVHAHPTEDKSYYALRGHETNMVPPSQKLLRLFNEPVE